MTWRAPAGHLLGNPRPAITYRGAIKNLQRGPRTSHLIRAARHMAGMSRREYDRQLGQIARRMASEARAAA